MFEQTIRFIKAEFWGDKRRFQNAFKVALACCIAVAIGQYVHFQNIQWSIITILIVALPNVGSSLEKSLYRTVGTIIGALTGAFIVTAFGQDMWLYSILMFAVLTFSIYMWTGTFAQYAFLLCATTAVITGVGTLEHQEGAISLALIRMGEVILGLFSFQLVNMTLWPQRAGRELVKSLSEDLKRTAGCLIGLAESIDGTKAVPESGQFEYGLAQKYTRNINLLSQAGYESSKISAGSGRYVELILATHRAAMVAQRMEFFWKEFSGKPFPSGYLDLLRGLYRDVASCLETVAGGVERGETLALGSAGFYDRTASLAGAIKTSGANGAFKGWSPGELGRLYLFMDQFEKLAERADLLSTLAGMKGRLEIAGSDLGVKGVEKGKKRFSIESLMPDRERLAHALLITVCAMVFIIPQTYWHLPFATTAAVTVLIIAQPTIGAMRRKAFLRNIGCLIGGGLALLADLLFSSHMTLLWQQLILIFTVFFICGYIKYGSDRISYAGVQMAVAFALSWVSGTGPDATVMPAINRLLGIIAGVLVGGYALTWFRPRYAHKEIMDYLEKGLGRHLQYHGQLRRLRHDPSLYESIARNIILDNARHHKLIFGLLGEATLEQQGRTWHDRTIPVFMRLDEELTYALMRQAGATSRISGTHPSEDLDRILDGIYMEIEQRLANLQRRFVTEMKWDDKKIHGLVKELCGEGISDAGRSAALELCTMTSDLVSIINRMAVAIDSIRELEEKLRGEATE